MQAGLTGDARAGSHEPIEGLTAVVFSVCSEPACDVLPSRACCRGELAAQEAQRHLDRVERLVLAPLGIEALDLEQLDADEAIVGAVRPAGQAVALGPFSGQAPRRPGPGGSSTACSRSGEPATRGSGWPIPWSVRPRRHS